ncbi:MAG: lipoyl(octanoyl) transferase LipB [Gammaproteobacteria bacterium]|nr:lipoyl(octanoyl) transferase LipB [Gammaproteobacteria bacterium]MBU0855259.1 lipoyl(octanoyl) transferase LipB [Gammaproteobacteria bacterium]MBU1848323.1 lipoyl(octanoyl) transferase LipB [Gammaproteobacteria bacterium]
MSARVRALGRADYTPVWRDMQAFTAERGADTPDELWQVEHPPVFTLGLAGKREHLLRDIGVPVVESDRGGQVTYHGPGQVIVYAMIDLKRAGLGVRELVNRIEQAVIDLLAAHGVAAQRRSGAPGVYVGAGGDEAKIAALGLRVKNGRTYHGVSLNVDMDLAPFAAINPCGYSGLRVTQTRDLGIAVPPEAMSAHLTAALQRVLTEDKAQP